MSLAQQASQFKAQHRNSTLTNAASLPAQPRPAAAPPTASGSGAPVIPGRNAQGRPVVFSQPRDTGVGRHWGTQLLYAIDFLRANGNPMRLEDLAIHSTVEALTTNQELFDSFHSHERVVHDEKTGLYSYKPDFNLRSTTDLHTLLVQWAPRGGLLVKGLRESWSGVNTAIEELEKNGKVLVTRTDGNPLTGTGKGQMKAVFLDEVGKVPKVDKEFKDLWSGLQTPASADDLAEELKSAGLSTSTAALPVVALAKKKKGRQGAGYNNRRLRITNTHLKDQGIDLSKDYVAGKKRA